MRVFSYIFDISRFARFNSAVLGMSVLVLVCLALAPHHALAEGNSSLYLFPKAGSYPVGEIFHISVNVDTGGSPVNAVEGNVSFNTNELEVVSVSKEGSILRLWTVEPTFSNETGLIQFGGGSTESYNGTGGKILSIAFRPLKTKASRVRFLTGAAILAADGLGTNILSNMDASTYSFGPKAATSEIESADVAPVPDDTPATTTDPVILAAEQPVPASTPEPARGYEIPSQEQIVELSKKIAEANPPTNTDSVGGVRLATLPITMSSFAIMFLALCGYYGFKWWGSRPGNAKLLRDSDEMLHTSFSDLHAYVNKNIEHLEQKWDGKDIPEHEESLRRTLRRNIVHAGHFVEKDMKATREDLESFAVKIQKR